jgi:hypothetical protein
LARGPPEAAPRIAAVAFELVVGPREPRHGIAVEEARPIAPAALVEVTAKRLDGRRDLRQPADEGEIAPQWVRDGLSPRGLGRRGLENVGAVAEPDGAWLDLLGGLSKRRQGRLEALVQLGQAWLIALGQQIEAETGHLLEPLIGLEARPPKGRPAFEREQIAGVATELGDPLMGCGGGWVGGITCGWGLGDACRGCFERTGSQAGHRQDTGLARRRLGFLTEHGPHLLAHTCSQRSLEGGINLGERFREVAESMGLAKLMATLGQDGGHRRGHAGLLGAEHGQNRPRQGFARCQAGFAYGLILLAQPAPA